MSGPNVGSVGGVNYYNQTSSVGSAPRQSEDVQVFIGYRNGDKVEYSSPEEYLAELKDYADKLEQEYNELKEKASKNPAFKQDAERANTKWLAACRNYKNELTQYQYNDKYGQVAPSGTYYEAIDAKSLDQDFKSADYLENVEGKTRHQWSTQGGSHWYKDEEVPKNDKSFAEKAKDFLGDIHLSAYDSWDKDNFEKLGKKR